jgi:hypothetical protein
MLDEFADDDPLFARVRAARPNAPVALERDVIAKLARPSRRPVIVGTVVAIAAVVCIVLLLRGGDDRREIIDAGVVVTHVDAPSKPAAPDDAAPKPPKPKRLDWTDLPAVWAKIELAHRKCAIGFSLKVLRIQRTKGGPHFTTPSGPLPPKGCQDLRDMDIPDMLDGLVELDLVMTPAKVSPPHEWTDPLATIHKTLAPLDLAGCVDGSTIPLVVIDRTHQQNPRISLRPTEHPNASQRACMMKLLAIAPLPPLPPFLLSITVEYQIRKP